ncbi:MAG TPA: HAMP domain-containing sensor histidine kinase [Candidatus Binatia bacterium]|nr:HAMP domain-containing sensor histidine kinase [Candidatus Binatia bacterium]
MDDVQKINEQLAALADHLFGRRGAILENWRYAVEGDPALSTASTLARREFYDHIPAVLDAFEQSLGARYLAHKAEAAQKQKARAAEHGLHRWHRGYNQQDVMREWGHLHLCLVDELENYGKISRDIEPDVMPAARRALARLCSDGVTESAARYADMQQVEAEGRIRDLERALEKLKLFDQKRGDTWRGAVHDLRGSFGVIKNISDLLGDKETDDALKTEFLSLLQKSVGSLHALLNNLLVLSRLEARQERRELESLDAAALLKELCESFQPLAAERGLFLYAEGPASLPVQGDRVNIQRIAQNLILNGLRYTDRGGVRVAWTAVEAEGLQRWAFTIEDTGPGFQTGGAAPLAGAIEESTHEAKAVEEPPIEAGKPQTESDVFKISSSIRRGRTSQPPGEGIGLAIVKRLCELLDATLELETERGLGSVFRVVLPRRYDAP